ncbi:response regulator [Rhodocaloribacter litoris]|uniref:response regulator n=1 Tax=Rhodocaloribacter litoris TaxID=2558931 RepID=UPI0014240657|nr:response regulator [Rhodocaloribacter litoris]QXD16331.1 response regulator [Rhodocaloribacter litoris]
MTDKAIEILLVEDNPDDIELTLLALEEYHVLNRVHVVRDGAEALDFIFCRNRYADRDFANKPRVVLLDLKLPLVDGLEVLKTLKQNPTTRQIPVVVLTSSKQETDLVRSYELGVNSYIVKPVDFDQFKEAMRTIGYYWLLLNECPGDLSPPGRGV